MAKHFPLLSHSNNYHVPEVEEIEESVRKQQKEILLFDEKIDLRWKQRQNKLTPSLTYFNLEGRKERIKVLPKQFKSKIR